jgi:nickel-dependent lactate racemase
MMELQVEYDGTQVKAAIPENWDVEIVEPLSLYNDREENEVISSSLRHPLESPPFAQFVEKFESILLIVNDHARATPTPKVLKHLMPHLKGKRIGVIVASGTHSLPSEEDLENLILGEYYSELRKALVFHNSKAPESMIPIGRTSRGTDVRINRIINEYEAVVAINSVEPHYFAGFTGGRKSFLPGISAYESIESNHSMALLDEAQILKLKGNPLHQDLEEAARLITEGHPVFGINLVLNGSKRVVGSFAGDLFLQLYEAAELAKKVYAPVVKEAPDILISVVHSPLDQNLYQAQKGFENCLPAMKPGGIMILVASCYDGIGPEDYAGMLQSSDSPEELAKRFEEIKKNYQLGWHKVGSIPNFLQDKELWMVTRLPKDELERMFVRGFDSLQEAIDEAAKNKGLKARVLLVNDSGNVCPALG